jgi:hypothetical protein
MIEVRVDSQSCALTGRNMRITVQLDPNLAREFTQRGARKKQCPELANLLQSLSVNLVPLHPGAQDDALRSYFAIEVPDFETAANIVKQLRPCRGIRAAYVKPAEALPR